ncbi:MAG: tyrosine-type recombinase/integrase [Clostridiales bacterium]|nr:tyrosine-type recombinase/integrase [Clostridiales bacterium]
MSLLDHCPDILTVPEAAEILRVDPATINELIRAGEIICAEIAEKPLIPRQYLENFIEKSCKMCYTECVEMDTPDLNSQGQQHLDNRIELDCTPFQGEIEMAKITRTITINGAKHWIRANTEQEYADKLLKLVGSQGTAQERGKHLFADYAMTWFETYSKPSVETATATTYKRQLTLHLLPAFDGLTVEDMTTDDVQRLFNSMSGSKATKDKAKMVLNQILDAAVEDGLIAKSPLKSKRIKITGRASKATTPYSVEQMRYLVQHITDIKDPIDRAYLAIQALHPLRLEEVLGLQAADIDPENGEIHICRAVTHPTRNQPEIKDTKTQSSARTIGLSALAVPHLPTVKDGEFVFGGTKPLTYTQVRKMCDRIKRDTGFTENITPIRFRTTVLTDLYDQTKDIKLAQAAAGHTTSAMTLRYYVKGRETISKAAAVVDRAYSS